MSNCPYCNLPTVLPYTGRNDILIVGEYPEDRDVADGIPFRGQGGEILQQELARNGVNLWSCNLANFWLHRKNSNEDCQNHSVTTLLREMAGRKVLLMGSEMAKYFTGTSVTELGGLEITSPLFPASVQFVMVSVSPRSCLRAPLGEFRLGLNRFLNRCKGG